MNSTRLEQLQAFLAESPKDAFLQFAIAKEYESLGDQEKALQSYLTLREQQADYVGTYYHLGKLYEALEDFDKAEEVYQAGMEVAKGQGDKHALGELRGAWEQIAED